MAKRSVVSAGQRRALAVLSELRIVADDLYLAGGVGDVPPAGESDTGPLHGVARRVPNQQRG